MDFTTPGYGTWKNYLQSELDMPGEYVRSKIEYYKMRQEVYAKGGCGEIHLGRDSNSLMRVAIKKGYSKNQSTHGVTSSFIREIGILKELTLYHHKNIVELVDVFPSDGTIFLVEKFYPSFIQQYLIGSETPFSETQIKYIMYSIAKALLFLKEHRLIHGDVKPANFLVSFEYLIALTDFGCVRRCNKDGFYEAQSSCISTLYYNAPEIILGIRKLTYAVDVWSFAITWLRIMGIWICEPFQKGAHISELSFCEKLFNLLNEKPSPEVWSKLKESQSLPSVPIESSESLYTKLRNRVPESLCSDVGISLLSSILRLNPEDRPSIEEICKHPYFDDCIYEKVIKGEMGGEEIVPDLQLLRKRLEPPVEKPEESTANTEPDDKVRRSLTFETLTTTLTTTVYPNDIDNSIVI